jgi:hypothetical protein
MKISIERSFDVSDFKIEEVNRSSKWKSIKSRADYVAGEVFYSVYYGIASHSIHGNWQDVLMNNLEKNGDNFKLNMDWNVSRPQMLDSPIFFNLDILKIFTQKELSAYHHSDIIENNYETLMTYQSHLNEYHELLLARNNG